MNKFVFEFVSEQNVKIVFFNFYNLITTKKINVINYILINKKTHKRFIEKKIWLNKKITNFTIIFTITRIIKVIIKIKIMQKKVIIKKIDKNESKEKIDFENNVIMFD